VSETGARAEAFAPKNTKEKKTTGVFFVFFVARSFRHSPHGEASDARP